MELYGAGNFSVIGHKNFDIKITLINTSSKVKHGIDQVFFHDVRAKLKIELIKKKSTQSSRRPHQR